MNNQRNRRIYRLYAPIYDLFFKTISDRPRQRAIQMLRLQPGERLLISGIGTGLDLAHLPADVSVTGVDLSPAMLEKARAKVDGRDVTLFEMDAQHLDFPDASFDAVLFSLLLSVVPDGQTAFAEGWRVLRPGRRAVIFDKFLPEEGRLTRRRRIVGRIVSAFGTDPNRRLSDIIAGAPGLIVQQDEPSLFRGQYRVLRLEKQPVNVNGLLLPKLLLDLLEQGRWKRPCDTTVLSQLTGSEHADDFSFLDVDGMRRETNSEHLINDEKLAHIYGLASSKRKGIPITDPTILDVDNSVLIAINWEEEAICLDYRTSYDDPRVVVSVWEGNQPARWKVVAPDFSSFVSRLNL
ncbi:MAG: methyltransferase domain-containing protein [Chloroflexi bacterium]|nr:methyltransferase domain-containing protein [Chloroflexota bacterium]